MELNWIKTFLKVSELHSFSRAAVSLGYAQPTVSTQIAKLEQELEHPLFERMGHRITLTDKGRSFLPYAQQMLLLAEQMEQDIRGNATTKGTLKIGLADSLCSAFFAPYLLEYRTRYPMASIEVHTGVTELLFDKLSHNEVDMLYTLDNRISRSDLVVQQEQTENIYFCAASDHPLVKEGRTLSWEDIKRYPLYLTEAGVSYRHNLERFLGDLGEELEPAIELGNVQTLIQLTVQSQGISFLPGFAVQEAVEKGMISILPVKDISIRVWRQLIYHKGKYLTPAMQGMLELLHQT